MTYIYSVMFFGLMSASTISWAQECRELISPSTPDGQLLNNRDGTISDTRTGLMWKQCSEVTDEPQEVDSNCPLFTITKVSWQEALLIPEALNNSGGFAGYDDWRIPNIKELQSLVENSCHSPAINLNRFPNTPSRHYWSSTPSANPTPSIGVNPPNAWYLKFQYGEIGNIVFESSSVNDNHVRLVRSER